MINDRANEMAMIVAVAEAGNLSAAARQLGLSPSALSKAVTRVETRLEARLLVRSTRAIRLTAEGEAYLAGARRALAEIEETERRVAESAAGAPRGRLRVNATVPFGTLHILPLVPHFLARNPLVQLDLTLSDRTIDIVGDRTDIAIRVGPLRDTDLKARKLANNPRIVVASRSYVERFGIPLHPADLAQHNCLLFNFQAGPTVWPFRDPGTGALQPVQVSGNFVAGDGMTVMRMVMAGLGVARLGRFLVRADLKSGHLIPLLDDWHAGDNDPIHAVFAGHDHLAARIRAFLDMLAKDAQQNERDRS